MLAAWPRPSASLSERRIARAWPRSSATGTARSSMCSERTSSCCRRRGCRCWRWRAAGRQPPRGLALAGALCRTRRGWAVARQDPQTWPGTSSGRNGGQGAGPDLFGAARCGHPLDRPGGGQGGRHQPARRAAHLGGQPPSAAPPAHLQALRRSRFAAKVEDIVGLYMDPPCHAVVLSIDEKSQIQALDRTQPGLPLKPGRCGTMTHDYKRNGTTTLFAALNTLDGTVVGRCMPRHTHKEFVTFLNAVERAVPAGKVIHAIVDNYATHKHPKVQEWLADHPRWVFHFTPNRRPGSTPSRASSRPSPAGVSGGASSSPCSTSRTPSPATSASTTGRPSPSSGPSPPTLSSPSSPGSLYLLNESEH